MTKLSKEDSIELVKQMRLKTLNKDAENTLSRGRKILESINAGDYTPNDTVKIPKAEYDALVKDAERYRWLKTEITGKEIVVCRWNKTGCTEMMVEKIDQAIDSARKANHD